ncbi:glycosyl hydrolase family 79 C-terminal domain-containing protein [Streptomyces sp. NBC_00154]|uniref:glycosyl hydrolase family 79 C-terminal domain-containing protein n=1 Tax=Streptomyces sp. NBC_00154 TaxID=2975670 RepID=UPI002251F3BF|nr:glycosyl hydrolase family 79 C-terminal domain-containing protein [Streptomyces sp. NBC_00154]MCX5316065.1 glycosyl hydrolase family 79 C-terminal domain-containing protein [Streptomyces sp. NBC_00154]
MRMRTSPATLLRPAALAAAAALFVCAGQAFADPAPGPGAGQTARSATPFALDASGSASQTRLKVGMQGFSVESADFAHGYLTKDLLAERLKTLGDHGVLRLGGYSMDLVWPAFGTFKDNPAPAQAIGGTADQADLDGLKKLLDATGWKVTLGVPLKSLIDPAKLKNPAKDPAPQVTMDQVVAEVKAAHATLGDDLLSVEVGNEYDNVTTLTPAEMWSTVKHYQDEIDTALPDTHLKMTGPSANTAVTNSTINGFTDAALADGPDAPRRTLAELASHLYAGSHCGTSTATMPQLMSAGTYLTARTKLQGIKAVGDRLHHTVPMTLNESNSASCSGQPGVSDAYGSSLWSLDYLLETAQNGVSRLLFHTNTAAVCGDFKPRDSADYPISYRYYGAFCAADQSALDTHQLSASALYYGLWTFRQLPQGRFVDLALPDEDLGKLRAYAIRGDDSSLSVVLINVQDPTATDATDDTVTLKLPKGFRSGRQTTLASSAPGGLTSLEAGAITLGGSSVTPAGTPDHTPYSEPVHVGANISAITVAPGTAQIVRFSR